MQKWEYLLLMHSDKDGTWLVYPDGEKKQSEASTLMQVLTELGNDGWEVIQSRAGLPYCGDSGTWPDKHIRGARDGIPKKTQLIGREMLFKRPQT